MTVTRAACGLAVLAGAACGSAHRHQPTTITRHARDADSDQRLDLCLGDHADPLDPAPITAAWQALARGEHPAPLHLRRFSAGQCVESWWRPVTPLAGCGIVEPAERWLPMRDVEDDRAGVAAGTFTLRPPNVELFAIDDHVVTRAADGAIAIETARGSIAVPGFPEHVIDDDHAIIADTGGMSVYDLVAGKTVLPVRPRKPKHTHADADAADPVAGDVAATEVVRDPSSPLGARLLAGVVFGGEWEAFAIDGRGKLLASVHAPASMVAFPAVTPEGAVVLVAYHDGTITITTVTGHGKPTTRDVAFDAGPIDHILKPVVAAAGDVVVVGFGSRAAILRGTAAPVTVDGASGNQIRVTLLAGAKVAVVSADASDGTFVIDTRTGAELARVDDPLPRFTAGAAAVVLVDPRAQKEDDQSVVIDADGTVRRGAVGETTIGRFTVRTFAGIADPATACDARALSKLPPLVQYDDYILPADLVVD